MVCGPVIFCRYFLATQRYMPAGYRDFEVQPARIRSTPRVMVAGGKHLQRFRYRPAIFGPRGAGEIGQRIIKRQLPRPVVLSLSTAINCAQPPTCRDKQSVSTVRKRQHLLALKSRWWGSDHATIRHVAGSVVLIVSGAKRRRAAEPSWW